MGEDTKKFNLIKIESKNDVVSTLNECIEIAGGLSGVMVLAITKDGQQILRTSTMSGLEKSFLCQFLNAWMNKWFELEE